jgi:glycosyltransferase involved in cell wall biosynthesis
MVYLRYRGSHFKTGWQADALLEEFRPMAKRGWGCHLVLEWLPEDLSWLQGYHELGVQIHCIPRPRSRFDWKCIAAARCLFRRLRPDIILCENIHSSPMIAAAAARVPVRIWIKHAMNSCFEECRQPGFKDRLMITTRLTCSLATRVLAVSGAVRTELTDLGISQEKILVRPNPRQFSYLPEAQGRAAIRTELGYATSDVVFVSVGHAVPVKGWDLLVQAFAKLAAVDARARLLLVGGISRSGETHFAAALKSAVDRMELGDRVHFTGHTPEIPSFLAASDVFVMPSRSEGFSCALIEGLEAGLPCIATRVGVAEDVIRPGHNGLLVERGQEQPLTEALITICRDDALRRRLALNAFVPGCIPTLPEYAELLANDIAALRLAGQNPPVMKSHASHA